MRGDGGGTVLCLLRINMHQLVEELFAYCFGIYVKFGHKNPSILTPMDSVDIEL